MQTGGLLKDLTVARDGRLHRQPVRRHPPGRRGAGAGRHHRHRRPPGREVLGRRAAAAAVRDGAAVRPRAADPRRADHRHGRRGPARLLGRHPARTPQRGRTVLFATHYLEEADAVRRPDRADAPGPDRRRRHRVRDQGAGRRPDRAGHPARRRPPRRSAAARRRRAASRCAATPCWSTPATPTRWPATCSPRPTPATSRSPPRGLEDAFLALTGDDDATDRRTRDEQHRLDLDHAGGCRRWAAST